MWQIVGHEAAVALLDNSLKNRRLPHAHLLAGPPQVGKMTLALNLAQALNCDADVKPCGICVSCRRITELKHSDVQVIGLEGKTETSIDQIREMEHCASLKPFEGRNRVFIIDDADQLSQEAANCLLKTLEEPPPFVHIILLSANERAVLPTIRSRCQTIRLRPLATAAVERTLIERFKVAPEQAGILAKLSSGRIGWAIEASSDENALKERAEALHTLTATVSADRVERLFFATMLASQSAKNRAALQSTLALWISWWRDLLLIKGECPDAITNVDQKEVLYREAEYYDIIGIEKFINDLIRARAAIESNANARLVLDVLMLGIPQREGG
jgi:DNA polymerase-3 subunit delta'